MFGDLEILRRRPIPSLESSRLMKQGYRDWPIDQTGSLQSEPLARASEFGLEGRNHYAHARNPPYWTPAEGAVDALLVRRSVGERLAEADRRLRREGLKLFLYDAWRPRAVQAFFHDVWMPDELRRRRPELEGEALMSEVARYWAAPTSDPTRPAPHATGGAVDLTLVWEDNSALFMGGIFDDVTELSGTDRFERDGDPPSYSHDEARANRRLLYWLMIEAGFANHPDEWWHYSYGDQMWAIHMGKPAALYGLAEPPPELMK